MAGPARGFAIRAAWWSGFVLLCLAVACALPVAFLFAPHATWAVIQRHREAGRQLSMNSRTCEVLAER